MRRALERDGFSPRVIEGTVDWLREKRYLDDAGFAARFARSRMAHRGLGRQRVRAELRRKGVPRAIIENGVTAALSEVSEEATVDALARRFWRDHGREEPARRMRKLWGLLLRRGFPASLVQGRLRVLWPRWSRALAGMEPEEPIEEEGA